MPFLVLLLLDMVSVSVDFNHPTGAADRPHEAVVAVFQLKSNRGLVPEVKVVSASPVGLRVRRVPTLSGVHVGRLSEGDAGGLAEALAGRRMTRRRRLSRR